MPSGSRSVVITGMGSVSAVGDDCGDLLLALERGDSGIRPIQRFDTSAFSVHLGAEVREGGSRPVLTATSDMERCADFARRAAGEAIRSAGLDVALAPAERVALVLGTGMGEVDHLIHELTVELAGELGIRGPGLTICTACSSSTAAIGLARELLGSGCVDVALAGGADVLTERVFAGFHALGVLSSERCAPFSTPFGTSLGEGAGFLVLERPEGAEARGAEVLAVLSGYGLAADGYHETSPDPRGGGVERAVRAALGDAGLPARAVGYVNAHGSGTAANDPSEWHGIQRALGAGASVPVSSTKGALGHAQGAAGVLETIVTILMMRRGLLPPTLNFGSARAYAPPDPVAGDEPRPHSYANALCLNSAFGGSNAALVVSREITARVEPRAREPVSVLGLGLVSRSGLGFAAWRGARHSSPRVPEFDFRDVSPRIDPRGLDATSRFLTAAGALALADAGQSMGGRPRPGAGLVVGATRPSPESLELFGDSITKNGLQRISAPAFARVVINAPAGFCSKLLGLRGPLTVLTTGAGSGLAAIILAAEILRSRNDVELMLAGGVDELAQGDEDLAPAGEGSAVVALAQGSSVGVPRIVSWGMTGPGRLNAAIQHALSEARVDLPPEDHVFDETHFDAGCGREWALPSALAFMTAVDALRRGEIRRALVTSGLGHSVSSAVLLEA